jgi:signal transduction histidine kinase
VASVGGRLETLAGARARADAVNFRVRGGERAAIAAREELVARDGDLPPSVRADLLLLLTELVTNAVRHGGASEGRHVAVTVVRLARTVLVAVTDPGPGFEWRGRPQGRVPGPGGYGLVLVDRMARRWAIERCGRSTTVWFELCWRAEREPALSGR